MSTVAPSTITDNFTNSKSVLGFDGNDRVVLAKGLPQ